MATRNEFFPSALFKFDNLERPVQEHLKNVYASLGMGMLSAAVGAYVHLFTGIVQAGFLTSIAAIGLMLWLGATSHSKENTTKRLGIFMGFTFCSGVSLGPLLEMGVAIEPSIIPTALMGTTIIFVSFTIAALYNNNRTFLYLGGSLMSALTMLMVMSFANIFLGSMIVFDAVLYLSLLVFCAFVLYDTQLIVEKRRRGDDDYIWHSVDLFLDFIHIFRKLMIILSKRENERKRRNNN